VVDLDEQPLFSWLFRPLVLLLYEFSTGVHLSFLTPSLLSFKAIEEYSEALKRDPSNYKVYSNRAASYTKMMAWGLALEDCDKCISIDPAFAKVKLLQNIP